MRASFLSCAVRVECVVRCVRCAAPLLCYTVDFYIHIFLRTDTDGSYQKVFAGDFDMNVFGLTDHIADTISQCGYNFVSRDYVFHISRVDRVVSYDSALPRCQHMRASFPRPPRGRRIASGSTFPCYHVQASLRRFHVQTSRTNPNIVITSKKALTCKNVLGSEGRHARTESLQNADLPKRP